MTNFEQELDETSKDEYESAFKDWVDTNIDELASDEALLRNDDSKDEYFDKEMIKDKWEKNQEVEDEMEKVWKSKFNEHLQDQN